MSGGGGGSPNSTEWRFNQTLRNVEHIDLRCLIAGMPCRSFFKEPTMVFEALLYRAAEVWRAVCWLLEQAHEHIGSGNPTVASIYIGSGVQPSRRFAGNARSARHFAGIAYWAVPTATVVAVISIGCSNVDL